MSRSYSFGFGLLLIGLHLAGGALGMESAAPQEKDKEKLAISVEAATFQCDTGIRFKWHITNMSRETVYVYSPFLQGQSADLLEYDSITNRVVVPTSAKGESSFPPYSYPDPTFRSLAPNDQIDGEFHEPISHELSCKNIRPKKLIFEVAWGTDITRVLAEISQVQKEGRVHPANPIVRWQRLARSAAVPIKYVSK